jgi:hypothetical protein
LGKNNDREKDGEDNAQKAHKSFSGGGPPFFDVRLMISAGPLAICDDPADDRKNEGRDRHQVISR